ncbi:hypothetical protein KDW41_30240, partial [Burkholderia vietnamiensis]|nr:hypothetical protein [Burkholderia vietnamiensis]
PFQHFGHTPRQRLSRKPFLLHRRFWQIIHPQILTHLVIATEPIHVALLSLAAAIISSGFVDDLC